MSSTPVNQSSKPSTPPKTLGWTIALFGSMSTMLTGKKAGHVDSSTNSTASKSRPSPKPFQNLEGFNTVLSPEISASQTSTTTSDSAGVSTAASNLSVQQLAQRTPGRGTQTSTAVPFKSPWKASPVGVPNGARFSIRTSKPVSSRIGLAPNSGRNYTVTSNRRVEPVGRIKRRNRYKTSRVFEVRRANRGNKAPIDKAEMNKLLMNVRSVIEAPRQKIESDNNFRSAFTNSKCRPGTRLHPSGTGRLNSRLPRQQEPGESSTGFVKNGKRDVVDDNLSAEGATMRKKRRVNFGGEENNAPAPIENLISTPSKDTGTKSYKRKATPYKKPLELEDDIGGDKNGEDRKMASPQTRRMLRIKRSPSSNKPDKRSEDFPPMPNTSAIVDGDFSDWSGPEERESSTPIKSNMMIPNGFMTNFLPSAAALLPDIVPEVLPQFQEKPLFLGPKKDRTVRDEDDDNDQDLHVSKRARAATWTCEQCGFDNDDDETYCQKIIKGEPCGRTRSSKMAVGGWGNAFDHLTKGKVKCEECLAYNDKSAKVCASCNAPLTNGNGSASANDKLTALAQEELSAPAKSSAIGSQGFSFGDGATAGKSFSFGTSSVGGTAAAPSPSTSSTTATAGGFKFGATAPSTSSTTATSTGFQFGGSAKSSAPSASKASSAGAKLSSTGFQFGANTNGKSSASTTTSAISGLSKSSTTPGGFKFGTSAERKSPTASAGSAKKTSGFQFGGSSQSTAQQDASTAAPNPSPAQDSSKAVSKPFSFGPPSTAPAPSSQPPKVGITAAPTPSTGTNAGAQLFGNFAASSNTRSSSAQAPKFSFGTSNVTGSTSEQESSKVSTKEPFKNRRSTDSSNQSGFSFGTSTAKDKGSTPGAPSLPFGGSSSTSSTTADATTPGFSFGGRSGKPSAAPTDTATAPKFSFGTSSIGSSSATMPPLGSVATDGDDDRKRKSKRRNEDESSTAFSSKPSMQFGSKPSSKAPAAPLFSGGTPATASTQAGAPAPFVFGKPSKENNSSTPASGLGSSSFGNASNNSLATSGATAPSSGPSFGSTPAPVAPPLFGSTPAPAPVAPFSFGTTPAPAPAAPQFGSTAPALDGAMTFGSTPAPGPTPGFGSTPAPSNSMNFGSTTPAQPSTTFGSASAAAPPFGAPAPMPFGSSAPAPAPVPFGQSQPFGNAAPGFNNATTFGTAQPPNGAAPMAFGSPAPSAPNPGFGGGGFGQQAAQQQQPPAPPNAGFSLGTGGGGTRGRTPGRGRRIIKARRPR